MRAVPSPVPPHALTPAVCASVRFRASGPLPRESPDVRQCQGAGLSAAMPRKPRVEYDGAVYQIMSRGDRRGILMNDDDRRLFLATLAQACDKTGCGKPCLRQSEALVCGQITIRAQECAGFGILIAQPCRCLPVWNMDSSCVENAVANGGRVWLDGRAVFGRSFPL